MDSKSISRKGVGVQVPASAPPDELARALVPVLLHQLNNTTQYLGALQAVLADPALARAQEKALEGLSETALDVDDLGWILGLVANAAGADLLLERRESSRLPALIGLVATCLRRSGRDLAQPDRALPTLDVRSAQDAWRIPWAIARFLHGAGMTLPSGSTLEWDLVERAPHRAALHCRATASVQLIRELQAFDARLEVMHDEPHTTLLLPPGTLSFSDRSQPKAQP